MSTASPPGRIACPHCQALIKQPALAAGSLVNCPKCGQAFRLGGAEPVQSPRSKVRGQETGDRRRSAAVADSRPMPPAPPPPPPTRSTEYSVPSSRAQAASSEKPAGDSSTPQSALRNPQSRPDTLVDPNLLPPPPPVAKPKATEVAIVCQLCGTRIYAPLSKVGQEIKCPDCHSRNVVPRLKEAAPAKQSAGPTLDDAEEFAMSEVFERPKYKPLVKERGEYEILSALDPATVEHRLTVPGERPKPAKKTADAPAHRDDEEVVLAPPVERVEVPHIPVNYVDLDPADAMYDGRYDDGVIGDNVDPRSPDAWKKAPFVYGIVEFLFFPSTLLRLIFFGITFAAVAGLASLSFSLGKSDSPQGQVLGSFLMRGVMLAATLWLIPFVAAMQSVVEATANGESDVTNWPDWNVYEWFAAARFILLAAFIAGVPGGVIGGATLAASTDDPMMAAFGVAAPPVLSWLVLFPYILFSMLIEDSVFAIASSDTLRSLKIASDGWVFFYMYSIVLVMLAVGAAGMMFAGQVLVAALGAALMVAVLMLYFRLLGRLMWYSGQREAKLPAEAR